MSGPHKLHIAKRFEKMLNKKVNLFANLAVEANMVMFGFVLNLKNRALDMNL